MKKLFTLIELIVVIVVIAILAAIVLINVGKIKDRAITSFVDTSRASLQTAVDLYFLEKESYPTKNGREITVTAPQHVDVEKLVKEGFVKKEIDLSKVAKQHYWIDVFGRVWGATEPALENASLVQNENGISQTLTVSVPDYYKELVLYEVRNGEIVTAAELRLNNLTASTDLKTSSGKKVTYRQVNQWETQGNMKVMIEIKDSKSTYLVGGVDNFDLETVPVGSGYNSEGFKVLRGQIGEFEYKIESLSIKKWLDFLTVEETLNGSKIEYLFSIKESKNGEYGEWTDDFYSLKDSYGLKVKVKMMAGPDGTRPSLYDLHVIYLLEGEKEGTYKPLTSAPLKQGSAEVLKSNSLDPDKGGTPPTPEFCRNMGGHSYEEGDNYIIKFFYFLEKGKQIDDVIQSIDYSDGRFLVSLELEAFKEGKNPKKVSSFIEIEEESCVLFTYTYKNIKYPYIPSPIIKEIPISKGKHFVYGKVEVEGDKIKINGGSGELEDPSKITAGIPESAPKTDKEVYSEEWETILDFRLFQQGSQKITTWYDYSSKQTEDEEKTRVLYRFAKGSGYYWNSETEKFPENESSGGLMVHVYLQVKKDYINDPTVADPIFEWIKIYSSDGTYDLEADRPQLLIYPMKDNNLDRETISDTSNITWHYEAEDPQGYAIKDIEWSPVITSGSTTYPVGEHKIKARVKNEIGIWSNWANYAFEVKQEKPTARFTINGDKKYIGIGEKVTFNTAQTIDPDGDKIVNYEWKNKQESYSKESEGTVTVSLRVQDSEGNWSDWYSKEIIVYDPANNLWFVDGEPYIPAGYANMFDGNRSSTSTFNKISTEITWSRDITGKTIDIYSGGNIEFYDKDNNILPFFNLNGYYSTTAPLTGVMVNAKIIVPEKAVKMVMTRIGYSSGFNVNDIYLMNEDTVSSKLSDLTLTSGEYTIEANWSKPNNITTVYFVDTKTNKVYSSKTKSIKIPSLTPDTLYQFKVFGVDSNFSITETMYSQIETKPVEVMFYGMSNAAFDKDTGTYAEFNASGTDVTWSKDISNRILFLQGGTSIFTFYDKDGNQLTFRNSRTGYSNEANNRDVVSIKVEVPVGAVRMNVRNYYSGGFLGSIGSIHLADSW